MNNKNYYDKKIKYYNLYSHNNFGNPLILNQIKRNSTVFDIGCNTGNLARGLVTKKQCSVYGVDVSPLAIKKANKYLVKSKVVDLEVQKLPFKDIKFDYIVLADVLEHIKNPKQVLKQIKNNYKFKYLVVSLPNIAFISVRLNLFLGKFNYTNHGIMDESHLHFYTKESALKMFKNCGYSCLQTVPYPLTNKKLAFITHPATKAFPKLLARQFVFILKKN